MQTSDERMSDPTAAAAAIESAALDQPAAADLCAEAVLDLSEVVLDLSVGAGIPAEGLVGDPERAAELPAILDEILVEEVSIDGMCGVY
jgi:mycofactocin precursor